MRSNPGRRQDKRPGTLRPCKHHGSGSAVGWSSVLFDEGAGHVLGAVRGLEVAFGGGDDGALHQDVARPGEAVGVAQAGGFGAFAQDRSRRRRGRRRSSMAVPFVGSHPERASGISAGYFGQPLPAAMWGLSLGWNAHLLNLDFDPTVVGIASQPFWLHWIDAAGKPDSHAPDFFARRSDGSAVVVDCRPVERRRPRDVAKFEATARACALAGWEYRLLGEADAW